MTNHEIKLLALTVCAGILCGLLAGCEWLSIVGCRLSMLVCD